MSIFLIAAVSALFFQNSVAEKVSSSYHLVIEIVPNESDLFFVRGPQRERFALKDFKKLQTFIRHVLENLETSPSVTQTDDVTCPRQIEYDAFRMCIGPNLQNSYGFFGNIPLQYHEIKQLISL